MRLRQCAQRAGRLPGALALVMVGKLDYVNIQPGTARHLWPQYAGKTSLVIQTGCFTADDRINQLIATPGDAAHPAADALPVVIPVWGATLDGYIRWLTDSVNAAAHFGMPVIAQVYPRIFTNGARIVFTPDEITYAVRIGYETGLDVIAAGLETDTLPGAMQQTSETLRAGVRGAVVDHNLWGHGDPTKAAPPFKSAIHHRLSAGDALARVGA